MDMSLILKALLPSIDEPTAGKSNKKLCETTCDMMCQHPGCWASVRRQQKGIARSVTPPVTDSDDSDSELDLPKQSICNLLGDYGELVTDRYPLSTGGRPSHQWEPVSGTITRSSQSADSFHKLTAPHNTKGSMFSKSTAVPTRRGRVPLVEVQEVFDKTDLNSQWDEAFVTKQYYMWVPNPKKSPKNMLEMPESRETYKSMPVLMKDLTECMVPPEIEQQREDTIMFDEWPVLKKKQPRTRSPPSRSIKFKKAAAAAPTAPPATDLDTEGINELLALPKDALMKVLEHTKKSDFTSKGKLRTILQEYVRYDERARMALNAHELFQQRKMPILKQSTTLSKVDQNKPPLFHLDDEVILDRMSSVNTPVKDKDSVSDARSVDSFPRYKKPLPRIHGHHMAMDKQNSQMAPAMITPRMFPKKSRIPAISLGLPELPSGVKTTKPFSYNRKSLVDFSLGPVITPPSTTRSSMSGDYSEHGTTIKVHAPSSFDEKVGYHQGIHSVSPALSTHVPQAPAVTPATFMSPTKSAPALRDYKDLSRDPTTVSTLGLSHKAMPPSRDVREATLLTSAPSNLSQRQMLSPLDTKVTGTPDDLALDTINETARENVEGSVNSSRKAVADINEPLSGRKDEMTALALEPSALTSIHTSASPALKTARSIESCPSPEQWPLISELSFENMMPRPSISEPALSSRTHQHGMRNLDEDLPGSDRDYARKVLDEKMTAESPAPPPPSPEPKDREYRSRKDLKSRDSLSMAPLFEVNEVDEGSPIKERGDERNELMSGRRGERRMKQVRQIHAVIPQAKVEQDKKEETSDEGDDVMVSQITVTHVTPKGPDPNIKKGEKVQETFLNVDIPAEEISSLKAEHGSSHQEDISSNDTVIQSTSITTGSEVSASVAGQGAEQNEEEQAKHLNENDNQNTETVHDEEKVGVSNIEERNLPLENDNPVRENSGKQQSEDSVISAELVCDSARFLNHEMVSPVDGELEDDGGSRMMPLLHELAGETTLPSMDEEVENNHTNEESLRISDEKAGGAGELVTKDTAGQQEDIDDPFVLREEESKDVEKKFENDEDVEPPGSFFFGASTSPSTSSLQQEVKEAGITQETSDAAATAAAAAMAADDKEANIGSQEEVADGSEKMVDKDVEKEMEKESHLDKGEDANNLEKMESFSTFEVMEPGEKETEEETSLKKITNVEEEMQKAGEVVDESQANNNMTEFAQLDLEILAHQAVNEIPIDGEAEMEIKINPKSTSEETEEVKSDGNAAGVKNEIENHEIMMRDDAEGEMSKGSQNASEGVVESGENDLNRDSIEETGPTGEGTSGSEQNVQRNEEQTMGIPHDDHDNEASTSRETGNASESEGLQARMEPEGSDTM